nr:hypothetical protein [uncultured Rhodopila sp.]
MDIAPPDMPSDDLQAAIVSAQEDLARAGESPFLRSDPYRFITAALSAVLGVFGRSTRRWERAVADVIAARDPLTDNDRAALVEATENGAYRAMRIEAQRVVRTLDRKTMALIGLCCGGAYALGVLSVLALLAFGVLREKAEAIPGLSCGYSQQGQWFCVAPLPKQH